MTHALYRGSRLKAKTLAYVAKLESGPIFALLWPYGLGSVACMKSAR